MLKIAIVGAGAAGLLAARLLSVRKEVRVTVFEKARNVGTKLRASGGGKANIMNADIKGCYYNNEPFMDEFLQKVNFSTMYSLFSDLGLKMSEDEEHRVYPATFFSATVIDVLMQQLSDNVKVCCDFCVHSLSVRNDKWFINDTEGPFDKVILASGSPANMIVRNRNGVDDYWRALALKYHDYKPSLVGFKIENYAKELSGCKAKAEVSLIQDGNLLKKEKGEVQFKDDGVSGIVVMNMSAYYNRLKSKQHCELSLNFLFDDDQYDVARHVKKFHNVSGLVHPKLNQLFLKNLFDLRNFKMKIKESYGMEFAQVCHGGISMDEVGGFFELKKYPNLYAVGEMLDIDGVCGGYNLFFAFASAYWASRGIMNNEK